MSKMFPRLVSVALVAASMAVAGCSVVSKDQNMNTAIGKLAAWKAQADIVRTQHSAGAAQDYAAAQSAVATVIAQLDGTVDSTAKADLISKVDLSVNSPTWMGANPALTNAVNKAIGPQPDVAVAAALAFAEAAYEALNAIANALRVDSATKAKMQLDIYKWASW